LRVEIVCNSVTSYSKLFFDQPFWPGRSHAFFYRLRNYIYIK